MFYKILEEAYAGDQMGLLARGLKLSDVRRDMWMVKFKTVKQNNSFRAQVGNMRRNATRFINYTP
jgi:translation elongation factor EF-Tu-like GTPase